MVQFWDCEDIIPNPAHFSRVGACPERSRKDLALFGRMPLCAGDPSLRLKSGSARDDAHQNWARRGHPDCQ
jgi:hypothetical protein